MRARASRPYCPLPETPPIFQHHCRVSTKLNRIEPLPSLGEESPAYLQESYPTNGHSIDILFLHFTCDVFIQFLVLPE